MVKIRGLRGLGKLQKEQKITTRSRIISLLEIAPFTYERLREISGIHRNTLENSLNELTSEKIIRKHKYKFEYTSEQYKLHKELFNTTHKKSNYYLLNYINHKQIDYYLDIYYNNNIQKTKELSKIIKINQNKKIILYNINEVDKINKKYQFHIKQREKQTDLVKKKIRIESDYIHSSDLVYWNYLKDSFGYHTNYLDTIIQFSLDSNFYRVSNPLSRAYFPMLNSKTAWYFLIK
jgi:hypothetical protein